jgi:hypothetical protein
MSSLKGAGALLYVLKGIEDSIRLDKPLITSQGRQTLDMYLRSNAPPSDEQIKHYVQRMIDGGLIPDADLDHYLELVKGSYDNESSGVEA